MTAFDDKTGEISRAPIQLVVVTMDLCANVYGSAPCTASGAAGAECYNSFFTCQDKANFVKTTVDYKYTSFDAPLPIKPATLLPVGTSGFGAGAFGTVPFGGVTSFTSASSVPAFAARPYIKSISTIPTKIAQTLTVKGRRKIAMVDEQSDDINIDPYYATRASIQGEYWKKFVARNPNYFGRPVKIYEGYTGLIESEYMQRWAGTLENISISGGSVTLSCIDTLNELAKLTVPDAVKIEVLTAIDASQTTIIFDTILKPDDTQIDTAGYVRIDDEIIQYTGLNVPSNQITGCTRGAFSTTAAIHAEAERVTLIKYFAPANPFDILHTLLNDAGISDADIDLTAWAYWQTWPKTDVDYSAIINAEDGATGQSLFWEIVNLLDCHVWQDESQKITIRRNIANEPGRIYTDLTDTANIILNSGSADYNEQSRRTRFLLYWGKAAIGDQENVSNYSDVDIALNIDAEGANGYDNIREEPILCRWFSKRFLQEETVNRYAANMVRRKLLNRIDAQPLISISVEVKDEAIKTGANVILTTDELLQPDGNPIDENYMVISRDKVGGKLNLQLLRFPKGRICFIAPSGTPDYNTATPAQREYGFIANSQGQMPNGDPAYNIW